MTTDAQYDADTRATNFVGGVYRTFLTTLQPGTPHRESFHMSQPFTGEFIDRVKELFSSKHGITVSIYRQRPHYTNNITLVFTKD